MTTANKTKFYDKYFNKFRVKVPFSFKIRELKQLIIRFLYIHGMNAIAKYWYLKNEEKKEKSLKRILHYLLIEDYYNSIVLDSCIHLYYSILIISSIWSSSFLSPQVGFPRIQVRILYRVFIGGLFGITVDVILRIYDIRNFIFKLKTVAPQAGAKDDAVKVSVAEKLKIIKYAEEAFMLHLITLNF